MLAGFSHGAAGIAYALNRLAEVTNCGDFRAAAAEACAYEAALFSKEKGNWPDLRFPATELGYCFQSTWCHGAPGIGLGRAGTYQVADGDQTRTEIEQAMAATIREGFGRLDHPCCGNLGRADVLLTAGRKFDRADWQSAAWNLGASVIQRARKAGRYELAWSTGPYLSSFHQGMAGVGYQLLRLAHPGRVPSVLLWE